MLLHGILLAALSTAFASPHERRASAPSAFVHLGAAHSSSSINLRIALVESNATGLIDALYATSDPASPQYGQHLSKDEVNKLTAPSQASTDAVNAWLASNNISTINTSPAGDWISISLPVASANQLLGANFSVFEHSGTGTQVIRTLAYSIPDELKGHIDLVTPTVTFPNPRSGGPSFVSPVRRVKRDIASSCNESITPACVQELYGVPTTPATQGDKNRLAVPSFIDYFASEADLRQFLTTYRPDIPSNTTFTLEPIVGGKNNQSDPALEADLDTQYTIGLATNVPVSFIPIGDNFTDNDIGWVDLANYLLSKDDDELPLTLSMSYGQDESWTTVPVMQKICHKYAQLGARGMSIIFGSGDGGVAGLLPTDDDGCTTFGATFPGGCPYITSVGGTYGVNPERAADLSGGGFSNVFERPAYQAPVVEAYLARLGDTYAGRYNATGRAYPDIAAQAVNVEIILDGKLTYVNGTSCSTPIVASIVALLNDQRVAKGLPSLGWLNPLIYANPEIFTDVTEGSNPGCGTEGYPAVEGWDPVTGFGTPVFDKLKAAAGL